MTAFAESIRNVRCSSKYVMDLNCSPNKYVYNTRVKELRFVACRLFARNAEGSRLATLSQLLNCAALLLLGSWPI